MLERAPYASDPTRSRGRAIPEEETALRTPFQRDRDRIVHAAPFRRLQHKTQVFVAAEGDHFRTRMTHTLEVAQITRTLARALALDEDLAEAVALAHDLGHPPFGHVGETALSARLAAFGGFDHNAQALRIVTGLMRRYAGFDGLNLSFETLEGIAKHNGPLTDAAGRPLARYAATGVPDAFAATGLDLELSTHASLEAQLAAVADDIAYDVHDIDDGIRAGFFPIDALASVPFAGDLVAGIRRRYPNLAAARVTHELTRALIAAMVDDVLAATRAALAEAAPADADAVRAAGRPLVGFSPAMAEADRGIKAFLMPRVYRPARLKPVHDGARKIVTDLVEAYLAEPETMPPEWSADIGRLDPGQVARRVADYVSGMTDRFALAEHRRRFRDTPDLR